jgi:hypothetical protein
LSVTVSVSVVTPTGRTTLPVALLSTIVPPLRQT